MRIIWISDTAPAGLTSDVGFFETHWRASMRFRIGIPARALAAAGVSSAFIGLDTPAVLEHLTPGRVDAVVFSKLSMPRGSAFGAFADAYVGTADHVHARGLPLILDLVDNVFATDRSALFVDLAARADALTAASDALAEICSGHTRKPVHVIGDPVEGERRPPAFAPPRAGVLARIGLGRAASRPLRLLWFGGQYRGFVDLAAHFPALAALARSQPVELAVVTNPDDRIAQALERLRAGGPGALTARFVDWSLDSVGRELDRCDLVLLPANVHDEMRASASANRLIRALWAGRAVVAHPVPSYTEFHRAAIVGSDLPGSIRWALKHAQEIEHRIAAGQAIVDAQYSPEAIGRRWREVLSSVRATAGTLQG